MFRKCASAAILALLTSAALATPAWAGPPYDTDDPQPTDLRHWEAYLYGSGAGGGGAFDGTAGIDLNYGAMRDVQLTMSVPVDFTPGPGGRTRLGDLEVGAKYRFYNNPATHFSIAAFPRLILPSSGRRYGSGKTAMLLPLWGQQDLGKWSLFGGGGYTINPGVGNHDYWQAAAAVTREISNKLSIGGEVTRRGPDTTGAGATTTLGIGAVWRLKGPLSFLASTGPSFSKRDGDKYHAYVALGLSY